MLCEIELSFSPSYPHSFFFLSLSLPSLLWQYLITYSVSGTAPDIGDTVVNKTKFLLCNEFVCLFFLPTFIVLVCTLSLIKIWNWVRHLRNLKHAYKWSSLSTDFGKLKDISKENSHVKKITLIIYLKLFLF